MEYNIRPLRISEAQKLSRDLKNIACSAEAKTKGRNGDWVIDIKSVLGLMAICEVARTNPITVTLDDFVTEEDKVKAALAISKYVIEKEN